MLGSGAVRRGVARVAGLGLVGALLSASALAAEPDEQPLRIQYTAHSACPDALAFFFHVRARTRRVRLAEPGELALLVSVRIEQEGSESVGTLELPATPEQSEPFVRQVRAASCEEVVLALSLVLALAYDPDAVQSFPSVALPANPSPPLPSLPPPPRAPEPVSKPDAGVWRAAFGLDGLFVGGMVASGLAPGLGAFAEIGRVGGLFAPTLTASFVYVPKESHVSDVDPSARFGYLGGRLALCPVNFLFAVKELALAPCLAFDLGALSASTELADPVAAPPVVWDASLLMGRFRWNFYDRFFGETIAGVGVTLKSPPDRFQVQRRNEETTVFEVPRVVSDVAVGLGAYFP